MKKCLSVLLSVIMLFTMLPSCAFSEDTSNTAAGLTESSSSGSTATAESDPITPLEVVRNLPEIHAQDGIEPYADFTWSNKHVSSDLADNSALAYSLAFSDTTTFEKMPAGFDPEALLEWGKYPGLNVDILHKYGFTGKGAVIAYVDQPIGKHPAYSNVNLHYTNNTSSSDSMHGPAVLSILAGGEIGTAPEAEVYYYGHASWNGDAATRAECLYQIIEQNKTLPAAEKITMVGFSDNLNFNRLNEQHFADAVKACEEAGIMIWFCGEYRVAAFLPYSDRNNPANAVPDGVSGDANTSFVHVPGGSRSTAASNGAYNYWSTGGLSWTMPYIMGLYAIAIEIDPNLSQDAIRTLVQETAYNTNGMKLINPIGFIAKVLQNVGRDAEAQAILDETASRSKYLYAVMNTAAMGSEDLAAVSAYLADITDATVLTVDAAYFATAEDLYAALQTDAKQRSGEIVGVQIFGTPELVPTFEVQFKVQMIDAVDESGMFMTDLFYGNFNNDPSVISNGYNVMDHFEQRWDVHLVPQWPVARLPLSNGEFSAFFEKYDTFIQATGLQRQELVNFSNPIFASNHHIDDMGIFLNRMKNEFALLDIPYRLYGNKRGQYPVRTNVLGGFTAENLAIENERGIAEFLINTHGQWNNIDKCFYEGGKEKRESLVHMDNINSVLDQHPYYLDMWACLNGFDMNNNLTTTALNGNCVGMFSATGIIANNGVDCHASLAKMEKSNFYYFYYHYLKALNERKDRSTAFYIAQREYALSLIAQSIESIQNGTIIPEGNYQFGLCNLLAYHNFGVLEPNHASTAFEARGYISQSNQNIPKGHLVTNGKPVGNTETVPYRINNMLQSGQLNIHSFTMHQLDNAHTRFTVEYTTVEGMEIFIFNPPDGDIIRYSCGVTSGKNETIAFDIPNETLQQLTQGITISFVISGDNRAFLFANLGNGDSGKAQYTDGSTPITEGTPVGKAKKVSYKTNNMLKTGKLKTHSFTMHQLDNNHTRFSIEFTATKGMQIFVFNPPNADIIAYRCGMTSGEFESLSFDISNEIIEKLTDVLVVNFFFNDNDRIFVSFHP